METKNAWTTYSEADRGTVSAFCEAYKAFLDAGKTERECCAQAACLAKDAGFIDLKDAVREGRRLAAGDRVFCSWMNKSFVAFVLGEKPLSAGMNILGAHIDSPRIDIKQNPLYEDSELAYLDMHYYGGIKKYQWLALPLALHGVVCKKDGTTVTLNIGENENDPVFYITDLLPHLASKQMEGNARTFVDGEALDLLIGSEPAADTEKDAVRQTVLNVIKRDYGFEEEDFLSAELEAVPAGKARDVGFDRSMISGYGHDDRVCAYPSLRAVLDHEGTPEYALCCILTDKEEIGSVGATGMDSQFFENIVAEVYALTADYSDLGVRRALVNSRMLSSDVNAAYDPQFAGVFEKKNTSYLGHGVVFTKFTGSRGKGGSNDANAEFIASLRRIMDDAGVVWQTAELGRVDIGGGGTIAYMCAKYGMNVIDSGVAVLSMHAPYEVISKADIYEAYKAYRAFLKSAAPID